MPFSKFKKRDVLVTHSTNTILIDISGELCIIMGHEKFNEICRAIGGLYLTWN